LDVKGFERIARRLEQDATFADLLTLNDQNVFSEALTKIDRGADEVLRESRNASEVSNGLADVAVLLGNVAGAMRDGKSNAEMVGDFLREIGSLVCVFGVLDKILKNDPNDPFTWRWGAAVVTAGLCIAAVGFVIEARRQ
jgi:hypothetical protein